MDLSIGGKKFALALVFFVFGLGLFSAVNDSVTLDEIPHLGAGYLQLNSGKMLLNLEHPPLAKVLAATPLMLLDLEAPSIEEIAQNDKDAGEPYWLTQWNYGLKVIFGQKVSPETILFWARIPMILLLSLTAWFVYLLGRRLFGPTAGLIALVLFSLSPNFLAQGRLITTDVAAALGFISTLYFFHIYLEKQEKKSLILAGGALGVANLFKFSSLALYPALLVLVGLKIFGEEKKALGRTLKRGLVLSIPVFMLGFAVTLGGYYLSSPGDVFFPDPRLDSLTVENYYDQLGILSSLGENSLFRPAANYLAGVASVRNRLSTFSGTYLFGNLSDALWPYFFPLSWLFKEPLPIILGTLLALGALVGRLVGRSGLGGRGFNLSFLLVPFAFYGAVAVLSKFNLGIRHLLPILPLTYLLGGWGGALLWEKKRGWLRVGVLAMGFWLVLGTLLAFPNFLAYFNELQLVSGKPKHEIFIDSNLDWGQNLIRLSKFVKGEGIQKIRVEAWFPAETIKYYIPEALGPGETFAEGEEEWVAVAVTSFQVSKFEEEDRFASLRDREPYALVGEGILVYRLD